MNLTLTDTTPASPDYRIVLVNDDLRATWGYRIYTSQAVGGQVGSKGGYFFRASALRAAKRRIRRLHNERTRSFDVTVNA